MAGPGPDRIRPIRHMVRGALFDILRHVVKGSEFLDLFAGTGSVGLEALSRGAKHVTFVDNYGPATKLIAKNLSRLQFEDKARIYQKDVEEALTTFGRRDRRFEVAFLGPPYEEGLTEPTLKLLSEETVLSAGGIASAEIFKKTSLPEAIGTLRKIQCEKYGQNKLIFYRQIPPATELAEI